MEKNSKEIKKEIKKESGSQWKRFLKEEDGVGVVELILILVILIGLVLLFKGKISELVEKAFKSISSDSNNIIN
ncbi:MAG: Flp1 family type IVb pilin [Acetivibrio sp.]